MAAANWNDFGDGSSSYDYFPTDRKMGEEVNRVLTRCPIHGHVGLEDGSVQGYVAKRTPSRLVEKDGSLYFVEPDRAIQRDRHFESADWSKPMKNRTRLIWLLSGIAVAATVGVCIQGKELSQLRSNRTQLLNGDSTAPEPVAGTPPPEAPSSPAGDQQSELLRLRNEISQLNRRKKELANISAENSRLKAELQTKAAASKRVPGYIRRSEAVMAGFARPEDTLQTFLWAVRNGDTNTLFQTFTTTAPSFAT